MFLGLEHFIPIMANIENDKYVKLRAVMYALTVGERGNRQFWLDRGFPRLRRKCGDDALFNYWKARLDKNEPGLDAKLERYWERYTEDTFGGSKKAETPPGQPALTQDHPTPLPTIVDKTKSFFTAAQKFIKNGFVLTGEQVLAERMAICKACDKWNPASFGGTGSCTLCGCSTQAKLRMPTEKCPADKWLAVNAQEYQSTSLKTLGDLSTPASQ